MSDARRKREREIIFAARKRPILPPLVCGERKCGAKWMVQSLASLLKSRSTDFENSREENQELITFEKRANAKATPPPPCELDDAFLHRALKKFIVEVSQPC